MSDIGLVFRILRDLKLNADFNGQEEAWKWALCFSLYHEMQPGMATDATNPMIEILDNESSSIVTRLAALAVLSKIGGDRVIGMLIGLLNSPVSKVKFNQEIRNRIFDVVEGKEVRLPQKDEVLAGFKDDVLSVGKWLERLEALNTLNPDQKTTEFLSREKLILAGLAHS